MFAQAKFRAAEIAFQEVPILRYWRIIDIWFALTTNDRRVVKAFTFIAAAARPAASKSRAVLQNSIDWSKMSTPPWASMLTDARTLV
jgi:hypothetical protein